MGGRVLSETATGIPPRGEGSNPTPPAMGPTMNFIDKLLPLLRRHWPRPVCEVNHKNALQLMVGVILSAQSTDKTVNEITPALFKKYPTAKAFADASPLDIENMIYRCGFFRAKTRSVMAACRMLVEKYGGEVPKTMEELLELPGIGRKSANVILGAAYGITSGIVVDTHMIRLANRFRLSKGDDPVKIEQDLMKVVPKKDWIYFSQAMVLHGRYICVAKKPRCWECHLIKICPFPDKILESSNGAGPADRQTITGVPVIARKP
jgi:endonuclease III